MLSKALELASVSMYYTASGIITPVGGCPVRRLGD